jgi:pSer/pThr/pTyr-binding forkhead associated (FHA) protein
MREANMEYIALSHLSGSKANQEERFPLDQFNEIILGRDPAATVSFHEITEAMVGRHHARITRNLALPSLFFITDLNSRNGTFVNQQRITGTVKLQTGDVVQCGLGGPIFRFSFEPEPDQAGGTLASWPTLDALEQIPSAKSNPPIAPPPPPPIAPAGKTAVVSLNAQEGGRSRKPMIVGGGILIGLIAFAAGIFVYRNFISRAASGAESPGATSQPGAQPNASTGKYGHAHLSGGDTAEAEKDAQRTAWRIAVEPYMALGAGHPGKAESDFDKPDGVAFSKTGLLFATDAGNRRVQIWDVKTGSRLAEFGHKIFGGEIVDIAFAPDNTVLITDQTLNLAYAFVPPQPGALDAKGKPLGPYDYQFKGTLFGEQGFKKLGGVAIDSKGRVYAVDSHRNEVIRFFPDGKQDNTWNFQKTRADGDTYLHGCEGIAIDEASGNLFIASEKDAVIKVFDWETGVYKRLFIGAGKDDLDKPAGKSIFFGAVEGLAIAQGRLLAVDESAGHIQMFDLAQPGIFNTDLAGFGAPQAVRSAGYLGFFGRAPLVDFEDKTNLELQNQVKTGSIIPGQANPPGHFCSPDSIDSFTDQASGETYIAVADQCNYRIVVYRWSDIVKAMGAPVDMAETKPATNEIKAESEITPAAGPRNAAPTRRAKAIPVRSRPKNLRAGRITNLPPYKSVNKGGAAAAPGASPPVANVSAFSTPGGRKAKKVKKEKKVRY